MMHELKLYLRSLEAKAMLWISQLFDINDLEVVGTFQGYDSKFLKKNQTSSHPPKPHPITIIPILPKSPHILLIPQLPRLSQHSLHISLRTPLFPR